MHSVFASFSLSFTASIQALISYTDFCMIAMVLSSDNDLLPLFQLVSYGLKELLIE